MRHIVARSINVLALAFTGGTEWSQLVTGFRVPALLGNIFGGPILVAALGHTHMTAGRGGVDV